MVIGEKDGKKGSQAMPPPSSIDNIMSGISNTGAVKMNNHRKKLRQRYLLFYIIYNDITRQLVVCNDLSFQFHITIAPLVFTFQKLQFS